MRTITAVLLTALNVSLHPLLADDIDDYVAKEMQKQNVPGLSLAIVKDGKVTKAKGYGLANVELAVPATERTAYQWASITKQFTGAAIQMLAVDEKLKIDDLLTKYYPTAPPAWSNMTLRHLLTHTSGIKSYTSIPGFGKNPRKDYTGEEIIDLVRRLPLEFKPGERHNYSNTGYFLLGYVVEKVSGLNYGEFVAARIFRPLKMETASFNDRSRIIPNRASGYVTVDRKLQNAEFVSPSQPFAAGGLIGTVLDLAKWDAALYSDVLLPRAARDEMWTPVKLNSGETFPYGFGWSFGEFRDRLYMAHGGGIPGFSTYIARFTKEKVTVIVLMNSGGDAQKIANQIAGMEIFDSPKR
jgi:D-alanyl-D-alanine carboxypeptidase